VNPVTNRVYVKRSGGLAVIADSSAIDTKVRVELNRLSGDTTSLARPNLTGKGVNRWTPGRTSIMGIGNRVNTTQAAWDWATILTGAGTDSVSWRYTWGSDSLIVGENFVCCVPFEDQAATTGNGSTFAGNLEVYPVYRVGLAGGVEETMNDERRTMNARPTIIHGVLFLPKMGTVPSGTVPIFGPSLMDAAGRKGMDLRPGTNDVRALAPGVYFIRGPKTDDGRPVAAVTKIVVAR